MFVTFSHKFNVLLLTFLSYASYHVARKPTSVVKNVLHHKNCSALTPPAALNITSQNELTWCNWHPFGRISLKQISLLFFIGIYNEINRLDGSDSNTLLGALDSSFLFAYAIGMFFT